MKIVNEKPPAWVYEECHQRFAIDDKATIYSWGDTIYNPAGVVIDAALEVHEAIHSKQQYDMGGPAQWWRAYLDKPEFRAEAEAQAYGAQYRYFCKREKDRNVRARYMHIIASALAGGMYGLSMRVEDARAAIILRS